MKKISLYVVFVVVCLLGCINQTEKKSSRGKKKTNETAQLKPEDAPVDASFFDGPVCYVLCDFSKSQEPGSQDDIVQNAVEIFSEINQKFAVKFININTAQFEKPFFEYAPRLAKSIETGKERKKREEWLRKEKSRLTKLLAELKASDQAEHTCIIRALGRIANDLGADANNKNRRVRIIMLSDMLEACSNDFGQINLETGSYKNAIGLLKKMKKPEFGFGTYQDININITASSRKMVADPDGLRKFWKEVLGKFDYTLSTPITSALPTWIYTVNQQ